MTFELETFYFWTYFVFSIYAKSDIDYLTGDPFTYFFQRLEIC